MMKKHLFPNFAVTMLMAFVAFSTLNSCNEDIVVEKQEVQEENLDIPEGVTVFSASDDATRTTMDSEGKFYWTDGDQIWVDVDKKGTFSKPSDDIQMSGDKRYAKFIIGRTLRDGPYNLTYTGVNSGSGTEVTIAAEQSQTMPNDPTHIGMDGDCASATATDEKNNGKYSFALNHKAHYLIFQPYKEEDNNSTWKLQKIEIIELDGKPLSGTYDFGMDGLVASSVQNEKSTMTLTISGEDGNGCELHKEQGRDSWYVVIAPDPAGTTHRLKIKYHIKPPQLVNYINNGGDETFVISRDEVVLPSTPNKVTRIRHKMKVERYSTSVFYMWDATAPYWQDISNPPTYYGANKPSSAFPSGNRLTPITTNAPPKGRAAANSPCKYLPNVNALTWYAMAGDARWDKEYPWCFDNDLDYIYTQGTWFLRWDNIVAANSSVLTGKSITDCDVSFKGTVRIYTSSSDKEGVLREYDGTDYRSTGFPDDKWFQPRFPSYKTGRPKDTSNYFFLPANGHIDRPIINKIPQNYIILSEGGGIHGCYWSSSEVPGKDLAYIMETKYYSLHVRQDNASVFRGKIPGSSDYFLNYNGRPAPTDWWK